MQSAKEIKSIKEASPGFRQFSEVGSLIQKAIEDNVFPGAVLIVGQHGDIIYRQAFGSRSVKTVKSPDVLPMSADTVFDIAALTNILVTTTILMKLVERQQIQLTDRVSRYIQGFGVFGKSPITIGQVLNHTSGLPHWIPLFEELLQVNAGARMGILTSRGARDYVYNAINRCQLKTTPGAKQTYSDIGFMLLGELIETLTGFTLDKAAQKFVFQPLGLKSTSYIDLSMIKRRGIHPVTDIIAPTEECPWRKRILCGEVHDDNAWAVGGIAGHSGVFSTAYDLHIFAREILLAYRGSSTFMSREVVRHFWEPQGEGLEQGFRLGWDSPNEENGMSESKLSAAAVGMCGFTGCSIWLEPEKGLDIILMSNRVHPTRANKKIRSFRPELHSAVLRATGVQ